MLIVFSITLIFATLSTTCWLFSCQVILLEDWSITHFAYNYYCSDDVFQ